MIYGLPNGVILELDVALRRAWNGGFVTEVGLRNLSSVPLEDWALDLELPPGVEARNAAHARWGQDGRTLSLAPDAPWLRRIGPDERVSLTFRAEGPAADAADAITPLSLGAGGARYPLVDPPVPAPGPEAPIAVESDVIVKSSWGTGAWVQIVLTNAGAAPVADWALPLVLPEGLRFASSGNAALVAGADGALALRAGKPFLEAIAPGQTIVLGLNLAGDAALLDRLSVGALSGSVPPTAAIDRGVPYVFDGTAGTLTLQAADLLANDVAGGGGSVSLLRAFTVAGGGITTVRDGAITYSTVRREDGTVVSADTGRVVLGYEIEDEEGLRDVAQVLVDLPAAPRLVTSDVWVDEAAGTARFEVALVGELTLDAVAVDYETRARSAREVPRTSRPWPARSSSRRPSACARSRCRCATTAPSSSRRPSTSCSRTRAAR